MPVSFSVDLGTYQIWQQMAKHGNRSQIMRAMLHGWAQINAQELTAQTKHLQTSQRWFAAGMDEARCNPNLTSGRCPECWPLSEYVKLRQDSNAHWTYVGDGEEE